MGLATAEMGGEPRVVSFLEQPRKLLIGGRWVEAVSGKQCRSFNPAMGDVLALVGEGEREDPDRAVRAARLAFESGPWRRMPPSVEPGFP